MTASRFWSVGIGAVASLGLAGFFGTQALEWGSDSQTRTSHLGYGQEIRLVEVSSTTGTIRVEHGSGPGITVDQTVQESLRAAPTDARVDGDTLRLSGRCGQFLSGPCSVSYVVRVPEGVSVQADTRSGSITASGIHGRTILSTVAGEIDVSDVHGSLDAETGSGSISAVDVDGDHIRLHTGSGSIGSEELNTRDIRAETGSGGIVLDLTGAPDSVTAHTGSGQATVRIPRGPAYDVHADSGSGGTDYDGIDLDSSSRHHIDIETGSGTARVRYRN